MDLVFEIGCEELPASFQQPAVQFMANEIARSFPGARVQKLATPRRLAVLATGLPAGSRDETREVAGPPANAPDKAKEGFARKSGVPVESLREKDGRLVATVVTKGVSTAEVMPGLLEKIVRGIPFKKSMRWDALEGDAFARPVHWIAAALDGKPLSLKFADVESGTTTRGHRFHAPQTILLPYAHMYISSLRGAHVLADWDERKARVAEEVKRAAGEAGGAPRPDEELLEIVTGLVEEPHAVLGHFDRDFLQLPPEVLISEMRGHQKYFAVQSEKGELLPAFVAVSNTRVKDPAVSRKGYERVLRARLSDGKFFFDEDRKTPLRARLDKLARRTFMQGLGTELQRVQRLREMALWLHGATGRGEAKELSLAAELCKCDLATAMVGEFPELQGVMGRVYALHDGAPKEVAEAILEHYLPRGAEDRLPQTDAGALLGMADRIDQLVGIFGLGKEPTGTADPYGLRRAALGLLRVTLARGYRFDMLEALGHARGLHQKGDAEKVWTFLLGRLEVLFKDRSQADSIQAVLHTGVRDVVALSSRLAALQSVREKSRKQFEAAAAAFKRIANILAQAQEKGIASVAFKPEASMLPAERELFSALERSREQVAKAIDKEDYPGAYAVLADLAPVLDKFFLDVLVMDRDPALRDNRLALLRSMHELFAPLADFSKLQVEKSA